MYTTFGGPWDTGCRPPSLGAAPRYIFSQGHPARRTGWRFCSPSRAVQALDHRTSICQSQRTGGSEYFADGGGGISPNWRAARPVCHSRSSALAIEDDDVTQVAQELGDALRPEGGVRRGQRIHVTAQLIDTQTGSIFGRTDTIAKFPCLRCADSIARAVALAIGRPSRPWSCSVPCADHRIGWTHGKNTRGLWHQSLFDVRENLEARGSSASRCTRPSSRARRGLLHT